MHVGGVDANVMVRTELPSAFGHVVAAVRTAPGTVGGGAASATVDRGTAKVDVVVLLEAVMCLVVTVVEALAADVFFELLPPIVYTKIATITTKTITIAATRAEVFFTRALRCCACSASSRAWRPAFCRARLSVPTSGASYQVIGPSPMSLTTVGSWL